MTPVRASPRAVKTAEPMGSIARRALFLTSCHFSAKSAVSAPTPKMVSPVAPMEDMRSSVFSFPCLTASTNWAAPRVPKTLLARSRAAASLPEERRPPISPVMRLNAAAGSSPCLARVTMPLPREAAICWELRPALSNAPIMAALSAKEKPRVLNAGAFCWTFWARSFIPTPVAWLTRKRASMACSTSPPLIPKVVNAAEVFWISTSWPRMRPASRYWEATRSRTSPDSPSRVLRSATVGAIRPNSAGTLRPTFLATVVSPSRAVPLAPVPTRIVSATSSKVSPTR